MGGKRSPFLRQWSRFTDLMLQVFQSYYQTTVLQTRSPSDMFVRIYYLASFLAEEDRTFSAWIGSIQYSLMFLPCLVWGRLFDLGYYKSVVLVCYIMLVISAFLVAECREYWHFVLCQGFAIGVGFSRLPFVFSLHS